MESRWSDDAAAEFEGPLGPRVYTSRLLGADPTLVMHGGGNTSVKLGGTDRFGRPVELLQVKGSGSDLADMTAAGFAPCRLDHLLDLAGLDELSDAEMAEQLRLACTTTSAPAPSVEAILHAILPATYVDHTHADAVLAITNTPGGRARIEEIYGGRVVVVDYVMPGFALARRCATEFPAGCTDATIGMVLMNHGIFSFGATARESYERMIDLVSEAEAYLRRSGADNLQLATAERRDVPDARGVRARLRAELSQAAGRPLILADVPSTHRTNAFLGRADLAAVADRGPMTPDHVIRTKRVPLVGADIAAYVARYEADFARLSADSPVPLTMLDPAPRVVLHPALGLLTAGPTAKDAAIARDIYLHTMDAIERAELLDGWQALPEADVFAVEYWELEQAKLRSQGAPPPFAGEVVLVTGAASGIGRATASAFERAGAAVVAVDIDPAVADREAAAYLGVRCDVTDEGALDHAVERASERFGGLDVVVCNAGLFPPSTPIDQLDLDQWRRTMAVNLDANLSLLRLTADLLAASPRGGRVVVNASKNVRAPGPGAAAYSASKAALTQLARVAALEWGPKGVRVNVVHPNAVFDTGIWDDATLAARADSYGITVDEYRRNNLLGVEITSDDVAAVIVALASPTFAKTTGAQIPIDGGTDRTL